MRNRVRQTLLIVLQLAVFFSGRSVQAADLSQQFITAKLASGVSISLPVNWKVISGNDTLALKTATGAALDLSGYARTAAGVDTILSANFPDPELYSSVTITLLRMVGIKPTTGSSFSNADLQSIESQLRKGLEAVTLRLGEKIIRFSLLIKEKIGEYSILHITYTRTSDNGETLVHMYKFFGTGKVYDIVISSRLAMQKLNQPVLQKMVQSVVIAP